MHRWHCPPGEPVEQTPHEHWKAKQQSESNEWRTSNEKKRAHEDRCIAFDEIPDDTCGSNAQGCQTENGNLDDCMAECPPSEDLLKKPGKSLFGGIHAVEHQLTF